MTRSEYKQVREEPLSFNVSLEDGAVFRFYLCLC